MTIFYDCRLIESDSKSLNSISNNSTHSRKSSDASQISLVSGKYLYYYFITINQFGMLKSLLNYHYLLITLPITKYKLFFFFRNLFNSLF